METEGLVWEDSLSLLPMGNPHKRSPNRIRILGRLRCAYDVSVHVDKTLVVRYSRRGLQVKGTAYSYHAWLASTEQDILRYDMAHGDGLHCHVFDLARGESALLPAPLDLLPTLDGFVRIACRLAAEAQAGSAR